MKMHWWPSRTTAGHVTPKHHCREKQGLCTPDQCYGDTSGFKVIIKTAVTKEKSNNYFNKM